MYYIYGVSVPSLLIESTDSMIELQRNHLDGSFTVLVILQYCK